MSNQRKVLAKYLNKQMDYVGLFGGYRRNDDHLTMLLKWVYPEKEGRKVSLRKDYVVSPKGVKCAADHLWIDVTDSPDMAKEFVMGQAVHFSGVVEEYNIVRQDVLDARQKIYEETEAKLDQLYETESPKVYRRKSKALRKKMKREQGKLRLVDYTIAKCQCRTPCESFDVDRLDDLRYVKYIIAVSNNGEG